MPETHSSETSVSWLGLNFISGVLFNDQHLLWMGNEMKFQWHYQQIAASFYLNMQTLMTKSLLTPTLKESRVSGASYLHVHWQHSWVIVNRMLVLYTWQTRTSVQPNNQPALHIQYPYSPSIRRAAGATQFYQGAETGSPWHIALWTLGMFYNHPWHLHDQARVW